MTLDHNSDSSLNCRREYSSPSLDRYGYVRELTQTGTSGPSESAGGSSSEMNCFDNFMSNPNCPG